MGPVSKQRKRQDLPDSSKSRVSEPPRGLPRGLWVVATPIGNLSDISERARQALSHADRILCEDTRRTAQLLQALGIQCSSARTEGRFHLERTDAYASEGHLREALSWLEAGENIALVTDAGTPAISDPGAHLVYLAQVAGVQVTAVPGASAVTSLLSLAGFGETSFLFRGFFPRKPSERISELKVTLEVFRASGNRVFIWFESPQRIIECIEAIHEVFAQEAPGARLCVAKELTKAYEKVFVGDSAKVLENLRAHLLEEGARGEWSVALLLPCLDNLQNHSEQSSDWVKALQCILDSSDNIPPRSASDVARRVSHYFGIPKKIVYEAALKISGKKN